MKLVLDEHYSPTDALQLRERGYDVIAVVESAELRQLPDEELLRWAQRDRRVVVTENVRDFMVLHRAFLNGGELHAGMLFTSPHAFPRRTGAVGHLIDALSAFLEDHAGTESLDSDVAWL